MGIQDCHYSAFISYRHLDSSVPGQRWADWVQKHIEGYETPRELVGLNSVYGDAVPAAMPRVFRDKDQLPAHGDLDQLLFAALDRSRVLIVLCSRAAATSPWVEKEVQYFKSIGRGTNIIALVIDGEPQSNDNPCFPPSLRYNLRADGTPDVNSQANPMYIDLRPPRSVVAATSAEEYGRLLQEQNASAPEKYAAQLEEARILLLGGALGLSPVELTQRELFRKIEEQRLRDIESAQRIRAARRQTRIAVAAAFLLFAVSALAVWETFLAQKEKSRAMNAESLANEEKQKAEVAMRLANEREKAAQTAKESISSLLGANFAMSTWGGNVDPKTAETVNESLCTYYGQHPPGDGDEENLAKYSSALNRKGDLLFGSGDQPDDKLSKLDKERRQEAAKAYDLSLKIGTRLVASHPTNIYHLVNLGATYERIGSAELSASKSETLPLEARKKHIEDAFNAYSKEFDAYEKATSIAPDNDLSVPFSANAASWRGWAREAAAKLEKEGSAGNLKMLGEAAKLYDTKRSIYEALIEKAQEKPQWQANVPAWQDALKQSRVDIERVTPKPGAN